MVGPSEVAVASRGRVWSLDLGFPAVLFVIAELHEFWFNGLLNHPERVAFGSKECRPRFAVHHYM